MMVYGPFNLPAMVEWGRQKRVAADDAGDYPIGNPKFGGHNARGSRV
jgi:hypothetical protein